MAISGEKGGAMRVCRWCRGDARGDKEDGDDDDDDDDNDDDDVDHDDEDICDGRRRRRERSARDGVIACIGGAERALLCVSLFFPAAVFFFPPLYLSWRLLLFFCLQCAAAGPRRALGVSARHSLSLFFPSSSFSFRRDQRRQRQRAPRAALFP
nr:hypothetical protein [Pandoravirus belohorizontensis]